MTTENSYNSFESFEEKSLLSGVAASPARLQELREKLPRFVASIRHLHRFFVWLGAWVEEHGGEQQILGVSVARPPKKEAALQEIYFSLPL